MPRRKVITQPSPLEQFQARYGAATGAAGAAIGVAGEPIAPEYETLARLFAPGGEFGAGQRAEIEARRKADVAASYGRLVSSGMWSGTTATGAQIGAGTAAQRALLNLEDVRYGKYAAALESVGAARTTQRQQKISAYQTLANLISGMGEAELGAGVSMAGIRSKEWSQMQQIQAQRQAYQVAAEQAEKARKEEEDRIWMATGGKGYAASPQQGRISPEEILKTLRLG